MRRYYRLDNENHCIPVDNFIDWALWSKRANRIVDYTQITSETTVSTVFFGLDHRHFGRGPPLLFETLVFGGLLNGSGFELAHCVSIAPRRRLLRSQHAIVRVDR